MMTYIVKWVLISYISVGCPDYKPDAYGRYPAYACLVNHVKRQENEHRKEFKSFIDAIKFIEDGRAAGIEDICLEKTISLSGDLDFIPVTNKSFQLLGHLDTCHRYKVIPNPNYSY